MSGCVSSRGITTLVLVWDNAGWHVSHEVRRWLRAYNQRAHRHGGVRLIPCFLPTRSPWLNLIEPKWGHGKRRVSAPARLLPAAEVEARVCAAFACPRVRSPGHAQYEVSNIALCESQSHCHDDRWETGRQTRHLRKGMRTEARVNEYTPRNKGVPGRIGRPLLTMYRQPQKGEQWFGESLLSQGGGNGLCS